MRKRILAVLLSALLVANISSCAYIPSKNSADSSVTEYHDTANTEENSISSNAESTIDFNVLAEPIYLAPHWRETDDGKRYIHFLEQMEQNVYDQWLQAELLKGERIEEDIYTEYLELWKTEIAFSIQRGEVLCGTHATITVTSHQYTAWKEYAEQWMMSADTLLAMERDLLEQAELRSLGALVSHCMLVRQQAISIKDFLYHLEFECRGLKASNLHSVSIEWAPEASELMSNFDQDNNILKGANQSVSDLKITTLYNEFRDQVIHSFEDRKLLEQSFSRLDTEDPDILGKISSTYYANMLYWERNEYSATASHGENIIEDPESYNRWLDSFDQLLSTTQSFMVCQNAIFIRVGSERYILTCTTVRENILNSKFFLYYFEYQQKASDGVESIEVEIKWATKG